MASGEPPAFVLAAPRSGTTWLMRALNAHPDVHGTELRLFGDHFDVVRDRSSPEPRLRCTLDRWVRAAMQPMNLEGLALAADEAASALTAELAGSLLGFVRRRSGRRVVVDKVTPYEGTSDRVVAAIGRVFPGARLVLLLRDGRDVATSGVHHWLDKRLAGAAETDHQRRRHAVLVGGAGTLDRLFSDEEIDAWAGFWAEPIRAARGAGPGVLELRYERMLDDLGGELGRLCAHLGIDSRPDVLAWCAAEASFERMSGGRRRGEQVATAHLRRGVAGDWRRCFTRRDGERFDAVAGDLLAQLGYARGREWIESLPETVELRA